MCEIQCLAKDVKQHCIFWEKCLHGDAAQSRHEQEVGEVTIVTADVSGYWKGVDLEIVWAQLFSHGGAAPFPRRWSIHISLSCYINLRIPLFKSTKKYSWDFDKNFIKHMYHLGGTDVFIMLSSLWVWCISPFISNIFTLCLALAVTISSPNSWYMWLFCLHCQKDSVDLIVLVCSEGRLSWTVVPGQTQLSRFHVKVSRVSTQRWDHGSRGGIVCLGLLHTNEGSGC